jgi:hypothetical protein
MHDQRQQDEFGMTPEQAARLGFELARLRPRVDVPAELDEQVAAAARLHLARPLRRSGWRAAAGWSTAAAALGFAIWLASSHSVQPPAATNFAASTPADLDDSGRVDILDAFLLARQLSDNTPADAASSGTDINQDGEVNQGDVDALAMMAVDLHRSSS